MWKDMYRILCVVNNTSDAMAYYRSSLPMVRMSQEYNNIEVDFISPSMNPKWDLLSRYNVCFIQRPDSDRHVDFLSKCKMHKLKIWMDFDDAFWHVTPDSPAFGYYGSDKATKAIRECIDLADRITVSTVALSESIKTMFNRDSDVIKNAIDIAGMQYLSPLKNQSNNVTWRGSHTHQKDLLQSQADIIEVDSRHDLRWTFMGYNPWMISEKLKNAVHIDYFDEITVYLETLRRMDGNIMIVPLVENPFNRCKSNIAGLESIICGMLPVVPAWWSDLDVLGAGSFVENLEKLIGMDEKTKNMFHRELLTHVRDQYSLVNANALRYEVLQDL